MSKNSSIFRDLWDIVRYLYKIVRFVYKKCFSTKNRAAVSFFVIAVLVFLDFLVYDFAVCLWFKDSAIATVITLAIVLVIISTVWSTMDERQALIEKKRQSAVPPQPGGLLETNEEPEDNTPT